MTDDSTVAMTWYQLLPEQGIEGVVAKRATSVYKAGRIWKKISSRHRRGADRRGHRSPGRPATLLLARYDAAGNLRLIARSTPLPTAVRRELAIAWWTRRSIIAADTVRRGRSVRFCRQASPTRSRRGIRNTVNGTGAEAGARPRSLGGQGDGR
ncbi:hypothetical protein [Streptomyces sp. RTd22]|uniref:hypothetical protein n=1 Tax=Streptomyces sp. RTd22 TaxID=1841249 RepID=UPI000B08F2DA|nr:hypothetical protein [Streptomyces sp. RTd22]